MTITLEISPETQAELQRQAALTGRGPEALAATLLAGALDHRLSEEPSEPPSMTHFGRSLVETCALVAGQTEDVDFSRDRSVWRDLDLS